MIYSHSGAIFASQGQQAIAGALAFWMANSSELLNFLKRDNDLSPLTWQSQLDLSHLVQSAYRCARLSSVSAQALCLACAEVIWI